MGRHTTSVARWTAVVAALVIAAFGGYRLAENYVLADAGLLEHGRELVPPDGVIVLEDGDQCVRSGWHGVFTLRDTCMRIYWELRGASPAEELALVSGAQRRRGG